MNKLIAYNSVLGTTKKYAEWLAQDISADVINFRAITPDAFDPYDLVIVTSGTYCGHMPLVSFLEKYWSKLKNKRVIVVAVGIVPPEDKASQESYLSIPAHIREKITYFKISGKIPFVKTAPNPSERQLDPIISYMIGHS